MKNKIKDVAIIVGCHLIWIILVILLAIKFFIYVNR
jgi:hypothetical protein